MATHLADARTLSAPPSVPDDETLANLTDYTRSIAAQEPESKPTDSELLPDVSTMIEELAARLETAPEDLDGWRMLGWSYFHTGRYAKAADAYAKALALDPASAELKLALRDARSKASASDNLATVSSLRTEADGARVGPSGDPQSEGSASIRSMVDGLADRLARSPRDVEGWTRLMRSRVVLGERQVAAMALRKALAVFKDDPAATGRIAAAAAELGLKVE